MCNRKLYRTKFCILLYQELNSLFKQYEMVCYHSTKTIDENVIRSNGLTTNEWNTYSKNMVHTLQVLHVEEKRYSSYC